ncbi:MAG: hypothetical protein HYZ40_04290 [Rhodospirillales bacterium]|nr:hypothetical protein [Rhodospirillales bacterium]
MSLKRLAAAVASALFLAAPAGAVDLNGKYLIIDAIQYSRDNSPLSNRHVAIQGLGGVLQWHTEAGGICYVKGRQIHPSVVYGPAATRSGRIDCEQQVGGTASDREITDDNASYTTNYSNAGDTLTLSGRLTWITTTNRTRTGPFAETTTRRDTSDYRQALTVRVTGPTTCEVVNFLLDGSTVAAVSGQPGPGRGQFSPPVDNYTRTLPEGRWLVPDRSKCRIMNHADYKGEPLASAR